jgi:hypothetical protein
MRSHRLERRRWKEHARDNNFGAFVNKVCLLKFLLAIKFNLHMLFFYARLKISFP